MRLSCHLSGVGLCLGLLVWAGCGTASKSKSGRADPGKGATAAAADDFSTKAVENRIEAHARFAHAVILDLNDQVQEAVEAYSRAAQLDSGNQALVLQITRRFLQLREQDKALEILQEATARPEATSPLFSRLAAVYTLMGQTNEAVVAARQAVKKDPKDPVAQQQLAQILVQCGQYEEGMKLLRRAASQAQLDPEILVSLAELCLKLAPTKTEETNHLKEMAGNLLRQAQALEPANPLLLQRMAEAFLFLGRTEAASEVYVRMLERFPQLPGLRERLVDLYLRQQDTERASNQLQQVLRDSPTNIRAQYLMGTLAYDSRDMEKAQEHFKKVILLNPDFEQAYYDLAGTQINLDQPTQALETLENARAKFKLRFVTELYSGLAYSRLKQYDKAVKHLEAAEIVARATDTNRLTHVFYFQIGAAYERNKQYEESERYFRRCLEIEPDFSEALNYLGYMWAERGENLQEAKQMIDRAVELEPDNAAFLDSLAWVLFKLNQPQEALGHLLKAVELSEEPDAVLYDHLGDIYAALDKPDQAREAWEKSLALEASDEIKKKLEASRPQPDPGPAP